MNLANSRLKLHILRDDWYPGWSCDCHPCHPTSSLLCLLYMVLLPSCDLHYHYNHHMIVITVWLLSLHDHHPCVIMIIIISIWSASLCDHDYHHLYMISIPMWSWLSSCDHHIWMIIISTWSSSQYDHDSHHVIITFEWSSSLCDHVIVIMVIVPIWLPS
jgi:hypothetical protein